MIAAIKLFKTEATREQVRTFVKEFAKLTSRIKEKREIFNEEVKETDRIKEIDDEIKKLRQERKDYIENNPVIQKLKGELDDIIEERRQLVSDAKDDGVPKKEIDLATQALKKDIDMEISKDIYANIADLVD